VAGIPDGTHLVLRYLVSPEPDRQSAAGLVQQDLGRCGIGLELDTRPLAEYLAPGPVGPVFGRQFDMAQFAWPAAGETVCSLFLSSEIPGPYPEFPKGWGGGNAAGYSNPDFDRACQMILSSLPESEAHRQALLQAQAILIQDVPVVPLYWRYQMTLARPEVCGVDKEAGAETLLWNLEELHLGDPCPGQ
jgi:peptide/nickel transport system substrate-binding protein